MTVQPRSIIAPTTEYPDRRGITNVGVIQGRTPACSWGCVRLPHGLFCRRCGSRLSDGFTVFRFPETEVGRWDWTCARCGTWQRKYLELSPDGETEHGALDAAMGVLIVILFEAVFWGLLLWAAGKAGGLW